MITRKVKGKPIGVIGLAGGFEFPLVTDGLVRSSNIILDKETGIVNWSEEEFVQKFKVYADSTYVPLKVRNGEFNSFKLWMIYGQIKRGDLSVIYAYLKTIKPVKNTVLRFSADNIIE